MAVHKDLGGTLQALYTETVGEVKLLLASGQISGSQFRKVYFQYLALLEEARHTSPVFYEQISQDPDGIFTQLRVKARAHAIEQAHDITSLFSSLNASIGGYNKIHETEGIVLLEGSAPRLLHEGQREEKPQDIGALIASYEINSKMTGRVAELFCTYVTAKEISAIAGYSTATFYNRIRGKDVQKNGKGGYLLDASSMSIFFYEKMLRSHQLSKPRQDGTFMTPEQIMAKFGYGSIVTVYKKLRDHSKSFETKKEGRTTIYLVTSANSKYLERQRQRKSGSKDSTTEIHGNTGDVITLQQMVVYVTEKLGDGGENRLVQIIEEHGDTVQVGSNQFSKAKLDELIGT